jgi:site-specific recombinase XerD
MTKSTTIDQLFAKFDGAFAENTIRSYRSDFKQFEAWCSSHQLSPLETSSQDIAHYIEFLEATKASSTIRRHIDSLSSILKLSGHHDPTREPEAILAMKRMHRKKGRRQKQATPLTKNVLDALLSVCKDDIRGLRDQVLLRLGNETMRRRSELCRFKFEDVEVLPNGRVGIRLAFSKTDQFGSGKLIPISEELHELIESWGERVGENGYLLRGIKKNGAVTRQLSPASINRRLKELQKLAGLHETGDLSGHSFRVGAALDLLEQGEPLEKIMLRGGWKSDSTAMRYLREWQAVT